MAILRYLKLRRTQAILLCFASTSMLSVAFPEIDISISTHFFHKGYFAHPSWWQATMHAGMGYFLTVSMLSVVALYVYNRLSKRRVCGVDGRRVAYLFVVLILGAGLIVNVFLKDNFGRARPREIAEFGGTKLYTPPFAVSNECDKNCSFSSGEAAGGFFALALAMALSRRRSVFIAAAAFGTWVSFCRIASGAHFLSDTVVSFFVMLILADALYCFCVLSEHERDEHLAPLGIAGAKVLRPAVVPQSR